MRRPRPRFTLRRLMLIVAVVAVLLGAFVGMRRRSEGFRQRAAALDRMSLDEYLRGRQAAYSTTFGPSDMELRMLRAHEARSDHFAALHAKYQAAARRPWLPVAPDRPPPPWPKGVPYETPWGAPHQDPPAD